MTDLVTSDLAASAMRGLMSKGVEHAESTMLQYEQAECSVTHYFGPGVYIRELRMKAGTFAIGHRQKHQHMNVLLQGRAWMLQNDGSVKEVKAPATFVGEPGRKMGYIVEDIVWQNVYATDLRDIDEIEKQFLDKTMAWEEADAMQARAKHFANAYAREDFYAVLEEYGFDQQTVKKQSEDTSDQIQMPMGAWQFKTGASPIHGTGIFMTSNASAGYVVGPARIGGMRTPLGRYTNHSPNPNAFMRFLPGGDVELVLLRDVVGCQGGHDGEEVTIDYRQPLAAQGLKGVQT